MTLKERLEEDYKTAFKQGRHLAVEALRMLKAEVKNAEIAKRKDFDDHDVLEVILRVAKRHQDSITAFNKGGRQDLADHEKEQLAVLQAYLPAKLSEEELRDIINELIAESGAKGPADFGRVMGSVMKQVKGQADGTLISKIVKEELNKKQTT
ncbi:MAG: GatB/YqeY domain-containing protein [Patescibacteria group bacterium]